MTGSTVQELGNLTEHESPTLSSRDATSMVGGYLDPQCVTSAGRAICHSGQEIHCGLSVISSDRAPETVAATDDLPARVDGLQHKLHQGPSVGPDHGDIVVISDLAADGRWPDFATMCVATMNLRSMVSIQTRLDAPDRASLSFYSSEPHAFDDVDLEAAARLAGFAAPMVRALIQEFRLPLWGGVQSDCSRVAVAIDTVTDRYQVNSADAFDLLLEASHDLHRALLGVSIEVIAHGRLPEEAMIRARQLRPAAPTLSYPHPQHLVARRPANPPGRSGPRGLLDAGGVHGAP